MNLPILGTERLRLRGHRLDDYPAMTALWGDPQVTRFVGGRQNPEAVWSRLLRYAGHWLHLGYGYWVLECRETGAYLGEAGLASYQRDLSVPMPDMPEAGWMLTPAAQGRGLGLEAMTAVYRWADARLAHRKTFAIFDPEHAASIALAVKLGFEDLRPLRYAGAPVLMMTRPKDARAG